MPPSITSPAQLAGRVYSKGTLVKGKPATIECLDLGGQTFVIKRGPLTAVSLEDEWYEDVRDPEAVITALKDHPDFRPDIFTFWQRLPNLEPGYSFQFDCEEIAALPITTHDHWWNHQIKSRTRSLIRKAEKEGIVVKESAYDDQFVHGMTSIFNEAPVRQGRKFWHYGKDFDTVKQQFARFIHRERMIGAYYKDEMVGFIMLGDAGSFGLTGQIISSLRHRDKAISNTLISKAVEVCERTQLPYLCYLFWGGDSLAEFKRRCGFEPLRAPRYSVPLTHRGRLALALGVHRGWKALLPDRLTASLRRLRSRWYERGGTEKHAGTEKRE